MPQERLQKTLNGIDQANQADPNREVVDGQPLPREYAYSLHMTRWLFALEPEPSEHIQIACRAQHLERWTMPRSDYGEGRKNYYQWRLACGVCMAAERRRLWRNAATRRTSASG